MLSHSSWNDEEIKKLVQNTPEFQKYRVLIDFKWVLAHDYTTEREVRKFWNEPELSRMY